MKGLEFPIIGTKVEGLTRSFDLADRDERRAYFEAKAGGEIEKVRKYLEMGTFMAYFVGKKNAGKGTYSGLMAEIFGGERIAFLGVGDLVREVHSGWGEFVRSEEYEKLRVIYRGFVSFEEAVDRLHGRSTTSLLPTEFILSLLKVRLLRYVRKAVFVDGLPRDMDQVSYSLYFRDLANARDDPDMFVMIDIPESVIDERIKYRVVCPKCKNPGNLKLNVTKDIEYDQKARKFILICDNPDCDKAKMEPKEGDEFGVGPIKNRLEKDEEILKKVFELHGMAKVLLRNHVPVVEADKYFDGYELTPEFELGWKGGRVTMGKKPWTIKDDQGVESYSLMASAVTVSLIKQLVEVLGL